MQHTGELYATETRNASSGWWSPAARANGGPCSNCSFDVTGEG